jgi:hypothetical protein
MPWDLTQQVAEEHGHLLALNVVLVQMTIQGTVKALRAHGDARDRRDPVMAVAVLHNRGFPNGVPRLANRRDQEEARLVDED